jgi:hypothetical protein
MVVGGNLLTGPAAAAYNILNQHDRLQMRQVRQWIEALTGFERNNRYVLRSASGQDLFFIKENSSCLERNCCKGTCKAWRMDVFLLGPQGLQGGEGSMTPFMHLEREFTCTCLHYNRPEVVLYELPSNRKIGSIVEPFTCCNLQFQIRDPNGTDILETNICPCKCGLVCPCPCDGLPCNDVEFPVLSLQDGTPVASLVKKWMWGDCCKCLGEWDNYWINFGAAANPDYKVMLLGLAIFIQMRLFDKRNEDGNNDQG